MKICLHQERNELGKKFRRSYENGDRTLGGRSTMSSFFPRKDGKCGTLTSVLKDNMVLEYEDLDDSVPARIQRRI